MKKLLLPLLLLVGQLTGSAQNTPPLVPAQIDFAGIAVHFDEGARQLIQQDVNALLANRKFWEAKLDRAVLYFPLMEAALLDGDVPTDFKYLAVQESSLTPDAVSTSTAVGYWQFKQETAQDQGLRIDDAIDERKSIVASTHGAARYLKKNNETFNNWVSSLFSYYLGAGGIAKLIPAEWSYAREIMLDNRTDRYVLRFFAHKIAIEKALLTYRTTNTFSLIEYPKASGRSLRDVAGEVGIDEFELRKYNRWVLGDMVPSDKEYTLVLPVANNQINDVRERVAATTGKTGKVPDFVQDDVGFPVLRRITTGVSNRNEPILYEINGLPGIQAQAGDNASTLAKKAKISFSSFLRYNDMGDRDPVVVNEVYYLAKKRKKALVPYHNVRENETSRSISQRYGLRLKKLLRFNRLDRVQKLQVGRVMWLRERRPNNRPVEVIKSPIPNVIDRTPARPVIAQTNTPVVDRSAQPADAGSIPRNASERKLYQPKLVPSQTVSSEQPQTGAVKLDPAKPASGNKNSDWTLPAPTSRTGDAPVMAPTPVVTTTTTPDPNGTQRTIIVRSDENPQGTTLATNTRTGRNPASTTPRPTTTKRPVTTRPDVVDEAVDGAQPVKPLTTGGYEELPGGASTGTTSPATVAPTTVPVRKMPPPVATPTVTTAANDAPTAPVKTTPAAERPKITAPASTEPPTARPTTPALESAVSAGRPTSTATATRTMKHSVETGQTYYSISKLYGVSIEDILEANKLTPDDKLSVGQSLTIQNVPQGFPVGQVVTTTTTAATTKPSYTTHTVAKGETMYRISKQYNVQIEQIKEWNHLPDVTVREGQKLKILQN